MRAGNDGSGAAVTVDLMMVVGPGVDVGVLGVLTTTTTTIAAQIITAAAKMAMAITDEESERVVTMGVGALSRL
ncbi:hypothetical protein BHQ18_02055 [Mycolicibacterium flavescens]|uniref:Uncharacterized protein n=1 Tax=Mycolicibacterium flavescens TaxID=1776 RepID=A0A1E3RRS3_MYCFV|nr:hypothetical protein BHQ18_02055 [Mycolicibacterium flavescens]